MSATFETKITAIRTQNVGELSNVIKAVEFTVKGSEEGQTFELPQLAELSAPEAEAFVPLAQVTEADVISWVESNFMNMDSVKAHIQYVLDREIAKAASTVTPMPWAPVVEPVVG